MKLPQNSTVQFKNCSILRNHEIIIEDLWVRNGKIINPENVFFDEKIKADHQIDCGGNLIAPGFIDLQINGGFGVDFSQDVDRKKYDLVSKSLLQHGVTSFCPTLVTSPVEIYKKALPLCQKRQGGIHGATCLGAHVEGPFINPAKKGAHPPSCMKTFDDGFASVLDVYGSLDNIAIITLAPELENSNIVIRKLKEHGVTVSVGHSTATLEQGELAVQQGATLITHLFNAMLPFHHRDPGLVGLLSSDSIPPNTTVYFGIISDGIHTHPAALRIAHRVHPKGLIIVTDAVSGLGFSDGTHTIGQMSIEIKGSSAFIAGTDTLCGSVGSMNDAVKFFKKATSCTVVEALEAATLHPALALNVSDKKGTLNFGADADLVILDADLNLKSTWIAGEMVYEVAKS